MEEEKHTQILTIKNAVTYIVDKNGNEIEEGAAVLQSESAAVKEIKKD